MLKKLRKLKKYLIAGSVLKHTGIFIKQCFIRFRKLITRIRKRADYLIGLCVRKIVYQHGEVQQNKIFVMTFENSYTCNPRYIVDEILRQQLPVDIVWAGPAGAKGKTLKKGFPPNVRVVPRGSYSMFEEMASSKIWLDNALNCVWYGMPKKKNQVYINVWHGSMGIKRLSGSRTWLYRAGRCRKMTDYIIANSIFEEWIYQESFWPDIPKLQFGHARNDILFDKEAYQELKEKVYDYFKVETNKKLFLYAPTFRDVRKTDFVSLDYKRLKNTLEMRFGGDWIILLRAHFKDRRARIGVQFNDWLKDTSGYPAMQELLSVVDAGMTDYSSWAFDYLLTRRPLFIYAPDIEDYDNERGFYYSLDSTPFPIARNNEQMEDIILSFDENTYLEKVDAFLKDKGCYEDGQASKRAVEKIKEILCS